MHLFVWIKIQFITCISNCLLKNGIFIYKWKIRHGNLSHPKGRGQRLRLLLPSFLVKSSAALSECNQYTKKALGHRSRKSHLNFSTCSESILNCLWKELRDASIVLFGNSQYSKLHTKTERFGKKWFYLGTCLFHFLQVLSYHRR